VNDHVILCIGERKFVLTEEEAFRIANTLNGATRIASEWVKGGTRTVFAKPQMDAAYIVPINGPLQLELETNSREKDEK
jgi:hypothetical protein